MLSPLYSPAGTHHGADTEVSSLPGAGPKPGPAGGLSGALTRDYGSKLRSGHPALGSVQCHQNHLESVPCVSKTVYSASSMTEDRGLTCQGPAAGILMCKN